MKKFIALVTLIMAAAFAGVCLAEENVSALNRAERAVNGILADSV